MIKSDEGLNVFIDIGVYLPTEYPNIPPSYYYRNVPYKDDIYLKEIKDKMLDEFYTIHLKNIGKEKKDARFIYEQVQ